MGREDAGRLTVNLCARSVVFDDLMERSAVVEGAEVELALGLTNVGVGLDYVKIELGGDW